MSGEVKRKYTKRTDVKTNNNVNKAKPINFIDDDISLSKDFSDKNEAFSEAYLNNDSKSNEINNVSPINDGESITEKLLGDESFNFNDKTWTPHIFNIGDIVYIPVEEVKNTSSTFAEIKVSLKKIPRKMTISSVVYTNHVSYTFKETSKIIASEKYIFKSEEECLKYCKGVN